MAIGAMRAIRDRGLRVPADISAIGFDDVAFAAYVEPALTTLRQETAEMGRWAVATLTTLIKAAGGEADTVRTTEHRIIPVELVIRASTGPAPGSPPRPTPGSAPD
jgi:LacI family transcriptional regulator, repressor for deo operon, udp, cdd, tsx, nupC, and nupG